MYQEQQETNLKLSISVIKKYLHSFCDETFRKIHIYKIIGKFSSEFLPSKLVLDAMNVSGRKWRSWPRSDSDPGPEDEERRGALLVVTLVTWVGTELWCQIYRAGEECSVSVSTCRKPITTLLWRMFQWIDVWSNVQKHLGWLYMADICRYFIWWC